MKITLLLIGLTLLVIVLPLLPALQEWRRPSDVTPLPIDEADALEPDYMAQRFGQRLDDAVDRGLIEIGGVPLTEWERTTGRLGQAERDAIAHRVVNAAYEVIEGKGATNYAIGLAATRIIESVLRDERRVLPVSRMLAGWHGISGMCMAVPTVVGRDGAGTQLELPVSDDELAQLRASAEHIRAMSEGLGF